MFDTSKLRDLLAAACLTMTLLLSACATENSGKRAVVSISLRGAAAHWVDPQTLLWDVGSAAVSEVRLYHSAAADLDFVEDKGIAHGRYNAFTLAADASRRPDLNPVLAMLSAWHGHVDTELARQMLKGQLIATAHARDGELLAATSVQHAGALDALYTAGDNDADDASLGISYGPGGEISTGLWAPSARNVRLKVYDQDKRLIATRQMAIDEATGIWRFTGDARLDRQFYRYEVTVFHPARDAIVTVEATDPYSLSASTNGRFSQFVNLNDADLKPDGWNTHRVPVVESPEDAIIYEAHIRDFSILDQSTSAHNRGKYLAFTESDAVPVRHLRALAAAGLTHIHLLPANDISSVDEDVDGRVDLANTVGRLCQANAGAPVCGVEEPAVVLQDVLARYDRSGTDAQALLASMRSLDGFNWGYDPHHFTVPEGSYASDPDGVARIRELRQMIQSLHETGLRVALDVVYNHTAASGLEQFSVLDRIVPGYYHRLNEVSGSLETSTCCDNTATERPMMARLMTDSLVTWARHYGFDSFRFDLMGHVPKQAIIDAREAVRAVDPDTYFYGEGWNFGEVANDRLFAQATQLNMAGTEIGTFNDRLREGIRQGALFNQGGSLAEQDTIRIGLAGTVGGYVLNDSRGRSTSAAELPWRDSITGYGFDPADIVNYVSKHDNETLWDQLQYVLPKHMTSGNRLRVHAMALAFPLLSQGIPFVHMGAELVRSKSMDRNSYNSGDWFNRVDFTATRSNWNRGLPQAPDNQGAWPKIGAIVSNPETGYSPADIERSSLLFREYLGIRRDSKLFRLNSAKDVRERVGFHNTGPNQVQGLIVLSIDDGVGLTDLDQANDAIVVVFNGRHDKQTFRVSGASGFELHPLQQASADRIVRTAFFADSAFTVAPYTGAVFVRTQSEKQGKGLAPPGR